jgi:hypothetical protein
VDNTDLRELDTVFLMRLRSSVFFWGVRITSSNKASKGLTCFIPYISRCPRVFSGQTQEVPPPKDMSLILLSIERLLLIHISIREDIEIEKLIERHTLNTNTKES